MLMRTNGSGPSDFIGVLDIGTSKTVCLIVARPKAGGAPWRRQSVRLVGFGCAPTHGVKAGVVIDVDGAEQGVREAVTRAEQVAEVAVDEVYLAVTGGGMRSRTFEADIADRRAQRVGRPTSTGCWRRGASTPSATDARCCI